jgi:hypothetical protein
VRWNDGDRRVGGVRNLGDWADEHWDVLGVVALTVLAFTVGALLAVAYNITTTGV